MLCSLPLLHRRARPRRTLFRSHLYRCRQRAFGADTTVGSAFTRRAPSRLMRSVDQASLSVKALQASTFGFMRTVRRPIFYRRQRPATTDRETRRHDHNIALSLGAVPNTTSSLTWPLTQTTILIICYVTSRTPAVLANPLQTSASASGIGQLLMEPTFTFFGTPEGAYSGRLFRFKPSPSLALCCSAARLRPPRLGCWWRRKAA